MSAVSGRMRSQLLAIFGLVIALVALVLAPDTPTGNVALDLCGTCNGEPVCAVKDGRAHAYSSACTAVCDGARVLIEGDCRGQ